MRVVDARSVTHGAPSSGPSGEEHYAAGHIPGAVHLDYFDDLRDPSTPYAARIAPPERFAATVGASGIGDGTFVVAYDAGAAPFAARIVWNLAYYGHDGAAVLAGGLPAWIAAGLPVSTTRAAPAPAIFTPRVRARIRASRDEALAVADRRSDAQFVDTQRDATYAQRDRDFAGAVRLSANLLLDDARGGRLAPPEVRHALIRAAGLDPNRRTIVACGSGVGASGAYLALRAAGFRDLAVYDGSWMEWEHDGLPTVPKAATTPTSR